MHAALITDRHIKNRGAMSIECRVDSEDGRFQLSGETVMEYVVSEPSDTIPFVKSIFHPSDFSQASELAFAHALAIALIRKTELVIMHAGRGDLDDWAQFPPVRRTLERWQVLAPGSPRSAVFEKLSVRVAKVSARGDPVRASVAQIEKQKPDLVVLATAARRGLPRWLKPSVAQAIAHRTNAMTLFVRRGCRGVVSMDGVIQLHRILIPVDYEPNAQEAVVRAVRAAEAFGDEAVEILLLNVNGSALPQLNRPESRACVWKELRRDGDVVETILNAANEADLIVMATEGRQGFVDAVRGSVTERVVRGAPCPVLAVPAA
jgi:nucleotide-binding universal stress UspA family protein